MSNARGRHQLIVLQASPFCNIDCSYCYLPDRSNRQRMSEDVLGLIFQQCFHSPIVRSPFTFLWHAGEPLVLPVEYYRKAFARAKELGQRSSKRFDHYIQTNGTLLNSQWIELIREFDVGIGISLDGPAFLHDAVRRTRAGTGTHARVMSGVRLLRDARIPFHVITVLTSESLDHAEELFRFYAENGITEVGFNIDEIEGPHRSSSFESPGIEGRYAAFFEEFLDLVERSNHAVSVREFESILRTLVNGTFGQFVDSTNQPLGVICFDYLGNISTFSPELLGASSERFGSFEMGNIGRIAIAEIEQSPIFRGVADEIAAGVQACRSTCEYWGFCGGGPPANKFFEAGRFDVTETLFCRVHKKTLVDTVLRYYETEFSQISASAREHPGTW